MRHCVDRVFDFAGTLLTGALWGWVGVPFGVPWEAMAAVTVAWLALIVWDPPRRRHCR